MKALSDWWDSLSGRAKGQLEATGVAILLPVLQALYQQLLSGQIDGQGLGRALEVGLAAGVLYLVAYLRALPVLPDGTTIKAAAAGE